MSTRLRSEKNKVQYGKVVAFSFEENFIKAIGRKQSHMNIYMRTKQKNLAHGSMMVRNPCFILVISLIEYCLP